MLVRVIYNHVYQGHNFFHKYQRLANNDRSFLTWIFCIFIYSFLYSYIFSTLCLITSTIHSLGGKFYLIDLCQTSNASKSIRVLNRTLCKQSFYSMYCAYVFSRETLIKSINKLTAYHLILKPVVDQATPEQFIRILQSVSIKRQLCPMPAKVRSLQAAKERNFA